MGSALFKPMEYSDCRAEKLSLSGLPALLSLKRPPGAGDTAGLWEAACALLLKQMCVVPARHRRRRGPLLMDVPIWGECIIEYPGSFQPDSWMNWLSCVPRWWEPPRIHSRGAGPVCWAPSGSWTLFPQSLQGADLQQENPELRMPCGFSTVSAMRLQTRQTIKLKTLVYDRAVQDGCPLALCNPLLDHACFP